MPFDAWLLLLVAVGLGLGLEVAFLRARWREGRGGAGGGDREGPGATPGRSSPPGREWADRSGRARRDPERPR